MARSIYKHHNYHTSSMMLLGAVQSALGVLKAEIEHQDMQKGEIIAVVGEQGALVPQTQLSINISQFDHETSSVSVVWKPRHLGGDQRVMAAFFSALEAHLRLQNRGY
jgi:translation initiation factor RLI1